MRSRLEIFIAESNAIEGILRPPSRDEIRAHERLLARETIADIDMEVFVHDIAGAPLREEGTMNVIVGSYFPPPGGPHIREQLRALLDEVNEARLTPFEAHRRYESLHPFLDGNGRSGRALWAWMMRDIGQDPFALPFLHRWYYQSLDGGR